MNVVFLLLSIVVCFGAVVLIFKLLGKYGLIAWIGMATIVANILTARTVDLLGFGVAQGTILFSSVFLCTDILCEKYGKKVANIGVFVGCVSSIFFIISIKLALLFSPSAYDSVSPVMETLFGLNIRIFLSSVLMYFIANIVDVCLFDYFKNKHRNKKLWLRNNVSTIVCNCVENFAFIFLAFCGIYEPQQCLEIAITTSLIELIIAVCDTPFVYIGRKINSISEGCT